MQKLLAPPSSFSPRRRARAGFTLLEIMLAVTIFSICITAIYTSFRTSAKAFESGKRSAEQMQTLRFTVDQITRDLRGIYYETDYNAKFSQMERDANSRQEELLQEIEEKREQASRRSYGRAGDEEEEYIGAKVNLRFFGEDREQADTIEFAHFLPSDGTQDNSFLGGERVQYTLENGQLIRRRFRVLEVMELNPNLIEDLERAHEIIAQEAEKEEDEEKRRTVEELYAGSTLLSFLSSKFKVKYYVPVQEEELPPELIASNVVKFNVTYGYFSEGEWLEAPAWDSESKEHRTPPFNIEPTDPEFMNKMLAYETRPADHLPTYVRLRIGVGAQPVDGKAPEEKTDSSQGAPKPGRIYETDTIVWLPSAQEVFVPTDEEYFEPRGMGELPDSGRANTIRRSEQMR